jgi:hypothetical protein
MTDLNSPLTQEQIAHAELQATHHRYFARVLVGLDEFMNVAADGNLDETISARSQRLADSGNEFAKLLTHGLDLIQPQHGRKAEAGQLAQAEVVEKIEEKALEPPAATP